MTKLELNLKISRFSELMYGVTVGVKVHYSVSPSQKQSI